MNSTGWLFLWHMLFKASYCFFQIWLTFIKLMWILVYTSNILSDCRFALIIHILNNCWILNGLFNNVVVRTKNSKNKIFAPWKILLLHLIGCHHRYIINFLLAYSLSFFDVKFMQINLEFRLKAFVYFIKYLPSYVPSDLIFSLFKLKLKFWVKSFFNLSVKSFIYPKKFKIYFFVKVISFLIILNWNPLVPFNHIYL